MVASKLGDFAGYLPEHVAPGGEDATATSAVDRDTDLIGWARASFAEGRRVLARALREGAADGDLLRQALTRIEDGRLIFRRLGMREEEVESCALPTSRENGHAHGRSRFIQGRALAPLWAMGFMEPGDETLILQVVDEAELCLDQAECAEEAAVVRRMLELWNERRSNGVYPAGPADENHT